jgi:hypothetical protein
MRKIHTLLPLISLVAIAALVFAACGDDDDDAATGTPTREAGTPIPVGQPGDGRDPIGDSLACSLVTAFETSTFLGTEDLETEESNEDGVDVCNITGSGTTITIAVEEAETPEDAQAIVEESESDKPIPYGDGGYVSDGTAIISYNTYVLSVSLDPESEVIADSLMRNAVGRLPQPTATP